MGFGIKRFGANFIRTHRRHGAMTRLGAIAQWYLRAYYNERYWDFDTNGERFVLETYASWSASRNLLVWDVGAHDGDWALTAHEVIPDASIHSFELFPSIFEKLSNRLGTASWSTRHLCGVSDHEGIVEATYNHKFPTTSAIEPLRESWLFSGNLEVVSCSISTVDKLIEAGVPAPQLLKIDVEGHEPGVFRGASRLLASDQAPQMIQFEYGDTWIPEKGTLREVMSQLTAAGYRVGRVYPNYVDFRSYQSSDDHFRMGNHVAARDESLIARLSGSRSAN